MALETIEDAHVLQQVHSCPLCTWHINRLPTHYLFMRRGKAFRAGERRGGSSTISHDLVLARFRTGTPWMLRRLSFCSFCSTGDWRCAVALVEMLCTKASSQFS
jgi:hypothetical protein